VDKHRLVTRSDFDGLICAVLLRELDLIDDITFVHPKDVQDGVVPLTPRDITTNLPYDPRVGLAFDHHASETIRVAHGAARHVIDPTAPSAARVVFDHYGGAERFPMIDPALMAAVDQADSAHFSKDDVTDPHGWVLLNFIMDSRTGLGRFRDFRISNYQLMMQLIDACRTHSVDEILALPDVAERTALYRSHKSLFQEQLARCSTVRGHLVVLDLRGEETIYAGNRFALYALHPGASISIHVLWGKGRQNTVLAMGKSIFDRSSRTDVGALMLDYDGGGHDAAGTCQVPNADADRVLAEVAERILADD